MLTILATVLIVQLSAPDTTKERELAAFIARVAESNARLPERLRGYRARVETELSFVYFSPDGLERTFAMEQLASDVTWRADGALVQHVLGYRSQTLVPPIAGGLPSSYLRAPYITATLFGDRLEFFGPITPRSPDRLSPELKNAVHPFGSNREYYYDFAGGDTVQVIRIGDRDVPVVAIEVRPKRRINVAAKVFTGVVYVDATRLQTIRMRGRLIMAGPDPPFHDDVLQGNGFVDFESSEYDGEFWLPREQRWEFQLAWVAFTETRGIIRAISRFVKVDPNDTSVASVAAPQSNTPYGELTGMDDQGALSRFTDWHTSMGALGANAGARDFDEFAPRASSSTSLPRLSFGTRYFSQMLRYNGVEGVFTGAGLKFDFGVLAPGLRIRAHAGYAWRERIARGGVSLMEQRGPMEFGVRGERKIATARGVGGTDLTEPDAPPLLGGKSYFDQRVAGVLARSIVSRGIGWRMEMSRISDQVAGRGATQFGPDDGAPVDRRDSSLAAAAFAGSYWLARVDVRLNPSLDRLSVNRGVQLRASYEYADGTFSWQRFELGAGVRRRLGRTQIAGSINGGVLRSESPPPQALYQIRRASEFVINDDRSPFTGDRVAAARASVAYTLPLLNAPIGRLPGPAPAPYAAIQYAWSDASASAAPVLDRFGWTTSGRLRAAAEFGVRLFGSNFGVAISRPIDTRAKWTVGTSGAY